MKFHWVKRGTCLHKHLRAAGSWRWFTWLHETDHEEICGRIRAQTHEHKLTEEEVHAIAATHQIHTRRWRWLLPALLLLLVPGLHAQGTMNVIPQKQFQDSVNHAFNVTCVSGCSASAGFLDNSAFTAGTTPVSITAGWFSASPTACTSGSACAPSMTSDRKLFVQDFQGTSPWVVSLASTTITGTVGVTQSTSPWVVSGTVTTTPPSNASTNVAQWAGNTLGTTSNYGTSPGVVVVPGVNAFITNTPAVTLTSTTITGTVAATQSGTWTVQPGNTVNTTPWLMNVGQFGGVNVSTGTGAGGTGIPRVTISNDSSLAANQSINVAQVAGATTSTSASGVQKVGITGNANATLDSTIGAATAPTNALATSAVFQGTVPTLTTGQAVAVQSDQTGGTFVNIEGRKQTYRAYTTAFAPIASATAPSYSITGSGTKTVRITRISLSCSAATGGIADIVLQRFSALSGGTSAAITIAKNDSGNATATAAPLTWSVAATTATAAGNMEAARYELDTPAVSVNPQLIIWTFGIGAQDFVLRGTSEFMGIRFSAIATTPTCEIGSEWTEE